VYLLIISCATSSNTSILLTWKYRYPKQSRKPSATPRLLIPLPSTASVYQFVPLSPYTSLLSVFSYYISIAGDCKENAIPQPSFFEKAWNWIKGPAWSWIKQAASDIGNWIADNIFVILIVVGVIIIIIGIFTLQPEIIGLGGLLCGAGA